VDPAVANWEDASEIGGLAQNVAVPRVNNKSFRWIAKSMKGPEAHDFEMIGRFCADTLYRVTFWHSWIHRSQYAVNDLAPHTMDLNFSPITVNEYGQGFFGSISEREANGQLEIGATFRNFPVKDYSILKAEGVDSGLVSRILEAKERYLQCGINVEEELQFGTVI
jgi:hypothetical protein